MGHGTNFKPTKAWVVAFNRKPERRCLVLTNYYSLFQKVLTTTCIKFLATKTSSPKNFEAHKTTWKSTFFVISCFSL